MLTIFPTTTLFASRIEYSLVLKGSRIPRIGQRKPS